MRDIANFLVCAALCMPLLACGAGDAAVPLASLLPRLSVVEEARIGSVNDADAGFSRIQAIETGADGRVYVLDGQAREVRVFGPDGRRLGTRGGPGAGPGEFSSPSSLGLFRDTLWVRDGMTGRISWFGPDGSLVHETHGLRLPVDNAVPGMGLTVTLGDPRADGSVGSDYMQMMSGGAADRPFYVPVVLFDRNGTVLDTLRWDTIVPGRTIRVGGRALFPPSLRPTSPVVRSTADGRVEIRWSDQRDVLEIDRIGTAGDTVATGAIRFVQSPVSEHVRDSLLDRPAGLGAMFGVSDGELNAAMAAGLELPANRPPIRSARTGSDGTVWLELNQAATDSVDWVVFDAGLEPRGIARLPLRMTPRHMDGPTVWAVAIDSLDVQWLIRLRIE